MIYVTGSMLKILQGRLQQYVNREFPDIQAEFRKGRGTRDPMGKTPCLSGPISSN